MIEGALNVGIEHKFGLVFDVQEDGSYRIMTGAPWTKAVTVGFKFRFPFGFERQFHQSLLAAFQHRRDA